MSTQRQIERIPIDKLSREEFRKKYEDAPGFPVILTGVMDEKQLQEWSNEAIKKKVGDVVLPVYVFLDGTYSVFTERAETPMRIADFLDKVKEQSSGFDVTNDKDVMGDTKKRLKYFLYEREIYGQAFTQPPRIKIAALGDGVTRMPQYEESRHDHTVAFFGKDSWSPLHYHTFTQAFLVQCQGTKTVVLYEPTNNPFVILRNYWKLITRKPFPDTRKEPHVPHLVGKYSKRWEVTIGPGEALFIPIYWWHDVFGNGQSFSYTHFYFATKRQLWSFWMTHLIDIGVWLFRAFTYPFGLFTNTKKHALDRMTMQ